jgi:DNA repair exonuclease SbcCD ATPase subunit
MAASFPVLGNARCSAVHAALILLVSALAFSGPLQAQTGQGSSPDARTPVEEFARQVDELKKTFSDLGKKIEDAAATIGHESDVHKARREIEALRDIVGDLLGQVSDNGTVSQLGARALHHAREKLRTLEQETRFAREEQQFLVSEWRKLLQETERATEDLASARKEFAELLRMLQTREDFIDELMQIWRAAEAIRAIRQLAKDIRAASDSLKLLIRAIKPPGA